MTGDPSFLPNPDGLAAALQFLIVGTNAAAQRLPASLPEVGWGETATLQGLAPHVFGRAARLDAPTALAHMDPPTPWISWALAMWNARLNQNLLHPATAPFAREAEQLAVSWLAPHFGMSGGHMTSGSTLANLTALWAARDAAGARRVVASAAAHASVHKAARILGLPLELMPTDEFQRLDAARLGGSLSDACLVLTAGTTAAGALDPLPPAARAAWTHVDAAWAGPMRLCNAWRQRLAGIDAADSVAISGHKWLFQPKESALILFRDAARANASISMGAGYLAAPNIGVQGSHGAAGITLLGTLLAFGRSGVAERIERCLAASLRLAAAVQAAPGWRLFAPPESGIVLFRPAAESIDALIARLPPGTVSRAQLHDGDWVRCVAANPVVDVDALLAELGLRGTE